MLPFFVSVYEMLSESLSDGDAARDWSERGLRMIGMVGREPTPYISYLSVGMGQFSSLSPVQPPREGCHTR